MKAVKRLIALFLICLTLAAPLRAHAAGGLSLKADQKSCSPYLLELTLRFQNDTRRSYGFGAEFRLEKYINGQWQALPNDYAYPATGYYLAPKSGMKHTLTLTDAAGVYGGRVPIGEGRYRVVWLLDDEQTDETVNLAAEFLVADTFRYAKEPVNLRTGPGTQYEVARELNLGECVSYIRKSGKWTLVNAGGQTGYVYGKYLSEDERDCYYNHAAVKLLGAKRAQVIGVYSGKASTWYLDTSAGRGSVLFDSDTLAFVRLKKPYKNLSMVIAVYPDDASAQKKFDEIAAEGARIPDALYSYFLCGRSIIRWSTGGLADGSRREQDFSDAFVEKLKALCSAFTS